jgi:hypothetical protein
MRWGALARNGVVIAVWFGSLYALSATEPETDLAYAIGFTVTILAGVLLARWWAVVVPLVAFAVLFGVAYLSDPSCTDCGEDPWDLQALYGVVFLVVPATLAMTLGVAISHGAQAVHRRSRRREQPAP